MPETISGLPPVQLLSRAENGRKATEYALQNIPELHEDQLASHALLVVASLARNTLLNVVRKGKEPVSPVFLSREKRAYILSFVNGLIGEVTTRAVLLGWDEKPQKNPQRINPPEEYLPQYDACTEVLAQLDILAAAKDGLTKRKPQRRDATSRNRSKVRQGQYKKRKEEEPPTKQQQRNKGRQKRRRDT